MVVRCLDSEHLFACAKSLNSQAKSLRVQASALLEQADLQEVLALSYMEQGYINEDQSKLGATE